MRLDASSSGNHATLVGWRVAVWLLRLSLAAAFLSAVADRFGWTGAPGGNNVAWGAWQPFVDYTGLLLPFLSPGLLKVAAVGATAAEILLGLCLLIGWRTSLAAYASAGLLLTFALSMTVALGIKAPLNYSVFTGVAAAFALGVMTTVSTRSGG